jgi:hypothetical protein
MRVSELLRHFDVELISEFADGAKAKVRCPHPDQHQNDDAHPSCEINLESGKYFCHACGKSGDATDYIAGWTKSSRGAVLSIIDGLNDRDDETEEGEIDVALVEKWHQALLQNKQAQQTLLERKGLTHDTIVKYRLGWTGNRVSMPVYAGDGKVLNIRQWSSTDQEKKVIGVPGHNKLRLYPVSELSNDVIIIVEGEMKALLLNQLGFHAVSATGGARKWLRKWGEQFAGKIVMVMYDIDKPGRDGSFAVLHSVAPHAQMVKSILLPLAIEEYPHGDVTDFIVKAKRTKEELQQVLVDAPEWKPAPLADEVTRDAKVYDVSLGESSHAKYYSKMVKISCVVSAKDTAPYTVPQKFQVRCLRDQEYCAFCSVFKAEQELPEVTLQDTDPALLELVNIKLERQPIALKKAARIPQICRSCVFVPIEMYNVEEVRLIPQLKIAENSGEHVVRRAFYVGHGIETNTSYEVEARCLPEPNTQYATLLINRAQAQVDSLELFDMTPEMHDRLRMFQSENTEAAVRDKLKDIYTDFESNVTLIRQRPHLHLVYDLVYHSVLYVPFQGKVYKGWVEALVVGDSSQGKSAALTALMEHYRLGEKVDCKGSSIAGLLGGLQETSRRWFISWGVITLNDRRLVALEEAKGLGTDMIAKMTDARSSGIIEISKIEKAKTTCRCRLIWISNSRSGRKLDTYNYGIEAVRELIGSLEDVRRFDVAICLGSKEVAEEVINARIDRLPTVAHKYTSDACRELVLWAWSRKPNQVRFEENAVDAILEIATAMGRKYSSSVPIVESADQRLKLARLSASLAARLFSTDDGNTLVVRECHVRVVSEMIQQIYDSASFGYLEYSKLLLGESTMDDEPIISKAITSLPYAVDVVNAMLNASLIMHTDLVDWAGQSFDEARALLGLLVRKRALRRYRNAYVKTPAFLKLLKDLRDGNELKVPAAPKHAEEEL